MKKIALSVAALALTAGSALAADLPSRKGPPVLPPPPPPPPIWTGFYVGLNAGYTWSNSNTVTVGTAPLWANPLLTPFGVSQFNNVAFGGSGVLSASNDGFIGGGQVGYNWQFYNNFVVGIEADIQGIAGSGNGATLSTAAPTTAAGINSYTALSVSSRLDYLGTVRGRLGWLFTPTLMVYGTGGLAYGGVTSNAQAFFAPQTPLVVDVLPYASAGAYSDTRVGWTAGGGVEWMFWPNWSAKVEYLYYDLGTVNYSGGFNTASTIGGIPVWSHATQVSQRFDGHIVRAGLNYHFNWGAPAPVVAKY